MVTERTRSLGVRDAHEAIRRPGERSEENELL